MFNSIQHFQQEGIKKIIKVFEVCNDKSGNNKEIRSISDRGRMSFSERCKTMHEISGI